MASVLSTTQASPSPATTSVSVSSNSPDLERSTQQPSQTRRVRYCHSCQQPCLRTDRSLIRALGQVYHYDCFTCKDCHVLVADKFYALNTSRDTTHFKIVCEQHYYSQVGIVCQQCRQPITTQNSNDSVSPHQLCNQCRYPNKCPGCTPQAPPAVGEEACYEYGNHVYCLLHFSGIKEIQCCGCQQAVLKQFVEHRSHPGKIWHPECYMIFKFWNVRLADTLHTDNPDNERELATLRLKKSQADMERKVNRIWSDLSSFEESSAACISDMLLLVAAGAYVEGFRMASQFVMHLEVLYGALDDIKQQLLPHDKLLPCGNEAKIVCHQVIRFFNLLAQSDDKNINSTKETSMSVTQELLALVTSLAQNLKTLIRIGLTEVLLLERDHQVTNAIPQFLDNLLELDRKRVWVGGRYWFKEDPIPKLLDPSAAAFTNNSTTTICANQQQEKAWGQCHSCHQSIDGDCFQHANQERWHPSCFACSTCQHPFANNLLSARFISKSITTPAARVLLCNQCATDIIVTGQSAHQDTTACSFIHLTQLQHYLYLLKLSLSRLYLVMNSSTVKLNERLSIYAQQNYSNKPNLSINSALITPSVGFLPMTKDHCDDPLPSSKQKQQKPARRTSLLGSIYLGNIKRVRSVRRDRAPEDPSESRPFPATSATTVAVAPLKRSLTAFDSRNQSPQPMSSVEVPSPSVEPCANSDGTYVTAQPLSPQPTSSSQSGTHRLGALSATKRASTSTIQRIGSLRRAFSQRGGSDRSHSILDRQQQQRSTEENLSTPVSNENRQVSTTQSSISSSSSSLILNAPTPSSTPVPTNLYHQLLPLSPNQYLIVSYLAAKTIGTLVHDMYTLDKWMQLVDYRKTSLWGRLKLRMKTSHQASSLSADQPQQPQQQQQAQFPQQKIFGVPLSLLTSVTCQYDQQQRKQATTLKRYSAHLNDSHQQGDDARLANQDAIRWMMSCFTSIHCKVPFFVQHCLMALLQRDMSVEGIFRKNGNIRELNLMEEIIDKDSSSDHATTIDLLAKQTSIQLAVLLKRYLRALPEPLLTYRLYPVFLAAMGLNAECQIKAALHLACCMLPKENRDTMQVIFGFLHHVSTLHDVNKMDVYNLARVIAPNVLRNLGTAGHQDTLPSSTVADRIPNEEIKVVEMLIKHHHEFGTTPAEMASVISDHPMVEWYASMDAKQFVKHYDDLTAHPLRKQPSSVPTLIPHAVSPHSPLFSGNQRRSSIRSQSTSPAPTESTPSKLLNRRSWMLRKQHV